MKFRLCCVTFALAAAGAALFRTNCTSCRNVDQRTFVPPMIVPMKQLFHGDSPTILAQRTPPTDLDRLLGPSGSASSAQPFFVTGAATGSAWSHSSSDWA